MPAFKVPIHLRTSITGLKTGNAPNGLANGRFGHLEWFPALSKTVQERQWSGGLPAPHHVPGQGPARIGFPITASLPG